ncbi:MAG: acyltransferase [Verrucomicrobia bacterium]|nr:acyltransferase [Verrucomicrobiota bacterium]
MSDSAPAAVPAKGRLDALTILRFGAALWVISFHLQARVRLEVAPLLHRFFANGAYAMTLFFVLSGAVLAYGYHRLQPRAADVIGFYQARFARIYAPYAVLHVIALIWASPTGAHDLTSVVYTNVLSVLGLQAWFVPSLGGSANSGTWSISAEFFFYALFPALLPLIAWLRERWGAFRVCAYLSALSGFIGLADYVYGGAFIYYILPAARLPEFMIGVTVGLELLSTPRGWAGRGLSLVLALAVAAAAAVNPSADYGLWIRANFIVVPAFAWLIYELARWDQRRASGRHLAERALIYLGESSYCLFLAHMLPMLFLDSPACRRWLLAHWQAGTPAFWAAMFAFSLVVAILLHELVEKPARRYLLRRWQPRHPPA